MSEVKEHSIIYLSPSDDPEREWCQDDVWEESVRYNLGTDFDRVTAERDAALGDAESLRESLRTQTLIINSIANARDALQQRVTAADELEADKRRLDLWQNNPGYFGGFAPSGDWSFFNPAGKTCYGKTLREALDQLGVMDADLKSRR